MTSYSRHVDIITHAKLVAVEAFATIETICRMNAALTGRPDPVQAVSAIHGVRPAHYACEKEDHTMKPTMYLVDRAQRNRSQVAVSAVELPGGCILYSIVDWDAGTPVDRLAIEAPK